MAAPLKPVPAQLTFDNSSIGFVYAGILGVIAISPSIISQGGASSGDVLTWSGSAWAPAAPSGGGVLWTLTGGGSGTTLWTSTINGGSSGSEYAPYQVLRGGNSSAF